MLPWPCAPTPLQRLAALVVRCPSLTCAVALPHSYSGWNVIDLFIVMVNIVVIVIQAQNAGEKQLLWLGALRALR